MRKIILVLILIFIVACTNEIENKPCTREYKPMCGIDEVTYNNPCLAGNTQIQYAGPCRGESEKYCEYHGGKWLNDWQECEDIDANTCDNMGGEWFECESACRNDKNAEMCTMQCVLVCKL